MATNFLQSLASPTPVITTCSERSVVSTWFARFMAVLARLFCGLRGHDSVLHFEQSRVMLRCTSCGYESPGWDVGHRPPRLRFEGDARRHVLRPQRALVIARKTA